MWYSYSDISICNDVNYVATKTTYLIIYPRFPGGLELAVGECGASPETTVRWTGGTDEGLKEFVEDIVYCSWQSTDTRNNKTKQQQQ